jgi:Cytochrome c554 and c-prime
MTMKKRRAIIAASAGAVVLAALLAWRGSHRRPGPPAAIDSIASSQGNPMLATKHRLNPPHPDDFVGAEACARCHAREYELWKDSTHGKAGGTPNEVTIIAKFD